MRFIFRIIYYAVIIGVVAFCLWYALSIPIVRWIATVGAVVASASTAIVFTYSAIARRGGFFDPGTYHRWLWIPWRPVAKIWLRFRRYIDNHWRAGTKATGGFAGLLHRLTLVYRPGDVLLGRLSVAGIGLFQPLGQKLERHLFMFAGTGGGKTTFLITMLGLHPGNVFVIDPKGQMATVLHRRRGQGGGAVEGLGKDVAILDPYAIVPDIESACWNPLDEIERAIEREGKEGAVKYAEKISEGLIRIEGMQPFFPRAARKFLTGLILHVLTTEPKEKRNMLRVYELANLGYRDELDAAREDQGGQSRPANSRDGFAFLLQEMARNNAYAAIPAASSTFDEAEAAGNVMATLKVSLAVYDNEQLRAISAYSTFSLHDLKLGQQDVFVCAPTGAVKSELSGWFRMLTVLGLGIFEYIPGDLKPKCFFAIDELPSLGNIEKLDTAPAVLRSYGVQLLGISQTVQALEQAYPKTWRTWTGNADAIYWMGTDDEETLDYLSKGLGTSERSGQDKRVFDYDTVKRFLDPDTGNMIVTRFGKRPIKVKMAPYYQELPVKFYDADPEHKERSARAATRASGPGSKPKAITKERIKLLPSPDPEPLAVTRGEAIAMFGLSADFSRNELDARRRQMHDAAGTPQMVEAVELAYLKLREGEGA